VCGLRQGIPAALTSPASNVLQCRRLSACATAMLAAGQVAERCRLPREPGPGAARVGTRPSRVLVRVSAHTCGCDLAPLLYDQGHPCRLTSRPWASRRPFPHQIVDVSSKHPLKVLNFVCPAAVAISLPFSSTRRFNRFLRSPRGGWKQPGSRLHGQARAESIPESDRLARSPTRWYTFGAHQAPSIMTMSAALADG
jgi:hypothetical protein